MIWINAKMGVKGKLCCWVCIFHPTKIAQFKVEVTALVHGSWVFSDAAAN